MNFIYILPVLLSSLILSAHFYRAGSPVLVFISLSMPFILLIRSPWAVRVIQAGLIAGGGEWIITVIRLVLARQAIGAPWVRLSLILGTVAVLTFLSALVFRSQSLRERYRLVSGSELQ